MFKVIESQVGWLVVALSCLNLQHLKTHFFLRGTNNEFLLSLSLSLHALKNTHKTNPNRQTPKFGPTTERFPTSVTGADVKQICVLPNFENVTF